MAHLKSARSHNGATTAINAIETVKNVRSPVTNQAIARPLKIRLTTNRAGPDQSLEFAGPAQSLEFAPSNLRHADCSLVTAPPFSDSSRHSNARPECPTGCTAIAPPN